MTYNNYYVVAVALLAFVFIARSLASYIATLRFKKAHGCKPPNKVPQFERILGLGLYKELSEDQKNKRMMESSRRRFANNGNTWSATMLGQTFFNTVEPENIKTILATNFKDYGLGGRLQSFGPLLGRGIFTSDGTAWEHSRALVRPNFTRSQVADLNTFETHINHLIAKIPRDGSTVDLQTLFFQLTLDSATEFLFGESVNSLISTEGSESQKFGADFDFAQSQLGVRNRMGNLVYLFRSSEFDKACKRVHEFVDKIVYKALEKTAEPLDAEKSIDGSGEPERYIFAIEMAKSTRDPEQLRSELLNILLAGRDTTASLLSHTFHVLARRPDIWQKLKAEVDELGGKKPNYDTLRSMKYLKNLLNESLRLYPVVPGNGRFANKDTVLPLGGGPDGKSPLFVPKGQVVSYSVNTMHRRKDIYGPDANEFRPERWNAEEGLRPGWGYLPFNGGPRICVGQQFALTEASYTIVRLVQEFECIIDRDGSEWQEQLGLTMACGKGVKVAMTPRN